MPELENLPLFMSNSCLRGVTKRTNTNTFLKLKFWLLEGKFKELYGLSEEHFRNKTT